MDLETLRQRIVAFRDERDWQQFHKPNHLAAAIAIEAAELQEEFLWKTADEVAQLGNDPAKRSAVGEEIADVLIYTLLLAHELKLDPAALIEAKLAKNATKYPVEKAKGSAKKYNEL